MKTISLTTAAVLALVTLAAPAAAQNREHVQMAAELRILQAQAQELARTLQQLTQALATLEARVDGRLKEGTEAAQRSFADQQLLITELRDDLRVVRERTQENNARVGTLREELEALREAVLAIQVAPPPPPLDPLAPVNPADPAGVSSGTAAPALPPVQSPALPAAPVGASPDRMFRAAWADYTGGQYSLAIIGFEQFLRSYPGSERADEAQLLIGDCHYQMNRFRDAIGAYNQVIDNYPTGMQIAAAYYKRGLAESQLGLTDAARASWTVVLDRHPTSAVAGLARQGLQRLGDPAAPPLP